MSVHSTITSLESPVFLGTASNSPVTMGTHPLLWEHARYYGNTPVTMGTHPLLWEHARYYGNTPVTMGTHPLLWEHARYYGNSPVTMGTRPLLCFSYNLPLYTLHIIAVI